MGKVEEKRPAEMTSGGPDEQEIGREEKAAIQVLRTSGSIAIFFLLAYTVYDLRGNISASSVVALYHWITVSAALLFFGVTWTSVFRRYWKFWVLGFSIALIAIFILISKATRDEDSRYVAILLFPIATASFVNWGWRWQVLMSAVSLALYQAAQVTVPLARDGSVYRWLGLLAALALAQATAYFMERYRERIKGQLRELSDAAAFRENQIATMAHDIRSPLAAIAGFLELMDDDELTPEDRQSLLARVGSTAWNMDLTIANVLDLYQLEEGQLPGIRARIDPNRVVAETIESCAPQAERKGLRLRTECAPLSEIEADPRHLGRVMRYFLAHSISRLSKGEEVVLRTYVRDGMMAIEVSDDGTRPTAQEIGTMFLKPGQSRNARSNLGLYVARTIVESAGGKVEASPLAESGLKLSAEIPLSAAQVKPDP